MIIHPSFTSKIPGIEIREDYDGKHYLSYPLDSATAIELEEQDGRIYIVFRKWDRTHGLSEEIDLADFSCDQYMRAIDVALKVISNNT